LSKEDLVCGLYLPVRLRVFDEAYDMCDFQVVVKLDETFVYKLAAVVSYDSVGNTVAADDVLPDEALDLFSCYGGQWFCLDPLREVDVMELFLVHVCYGAVLLALGAFFDVCGAIFLYRRLVVRDT